MYGPIFVEEPPTQIEYTNSSGAILNCNGQGNPPVQIQWLDDNLKEITQIPRIREVLSNGSLYIVPFSSSELNIPVHYTSYTCVLSNVVGTIRSRECNIRPEIINEVRLQVPNVFALRGNVAVLKCSTAIDNMNLFSITWFQDDSKNGRTAIPAGGRYIETSSGELHIREVTTDDSQVQFYCQISNKLTGERYISQPGHIVVTDANSKFAPRIDYFTPNIEVKVGNNVELICVAEGSPPPTYKWYHQVSGVLQEIRSASAIFVRPQTSVLQFPRAQSSDSSTYICAVNNALGEDRREMKLTVSSPLITFIRPQKQVIDSGSPAAFNCSVQGGIGDARITWFKNGEQLYSNNQIDILNKGETIKLMNVARDDRGMYQCFARNSGQSAQASAELILGAVSPELESTFDEQTSQPGLDISLQCSANGNPPPRILWYLDSAQIQASDGYLIGSYLDSKGSVIGHLNISAVRSHHGGQYTCFASNFLGTAQHSAMINIYGPPISRMPLNITAVTGQSVILRCPVSGFPTSSTYWSFGNDKLPSNHKQRIFSNGTLLLTELDEENDEGRFSCSVQNPEGLSANGIIYLNIMNSPEIMPFHFSSNLKEGGKAHISCTVVSGDLPITFAWRKDGKPLPADVDVHEQNMEMVSILKINNLSSRHSGQYTCVASNPAASSNYTAKLVVKTSPIWHIAPIDTTVMYHTLAVIDCQADGHPSPRITWMRAKGDNPNDFITIESDSRSLVQENGSLVIQMADRQHEGYYSCEANNGVGSLISKVVYLNVNIPAHFHIHSMNQSVIAGQSLMLTCEAEGDMPIRLTWNAPRSTGQGLLPSTPPYYGHKTRHGANSLIGDLHLGNITKMHEGVYQCTTSNAFGFDHMDVYLTVKELPRAPYDIEVMEVGSRWIKIDWISNDSSDTNYVLQIGSQNDDWANITTSNTKLNIINDLKPYTDYKIRMFGINAVGISPFSDTIIVRTLQEAPSDFPKDVNIHTVNENTVTVTWSVIHSDTWNGDLLGYKIIFSENANNQSSLTRTVRNHQKMRVTIYNLKYYATYEIRIRAFNAVGVGPPSTQIFFQTLESVPSEAPLHVHCTALTSDSIRVRWNLPPVHSRNGELRGYRVSYKRTYSKFGQKVISFNATSSEMGIDINYNLEKSTNYLVRVAGFTRAGEGVQSEPTYCTTAEDVPGAPEHVKAVAVTSDRILIVWRPPVEPNGRIIKYTVYAQTETQSLRKETVHGDLTHKYELRRLEEYYNYEFWVTAWTIVGEGQTSVRVIQKPTSRVPARIAEFSRTVFAVVGSDLMLECNAIGLPAPVTIWHGSHGVPLQSHFRLLPDKTLNIPSLNINDAGNYTCITENVFGKDQIIYTVAILSAPLAPVIIDGSASENTILLKWILSSSDGGSPINGFLINYETKGNKLTKTVYVDPGVDQYEFYHLKCGTTYFFTIQSYNNIGYSEKSTIFAKRTVGNAPEKAEEADILFVNSTSVTLYLDNWPETNCPVTHFTVAYKSEEKWLPVGNNYLLPQSIVISNLVPSTLYKLRVSTYNMAGTTNQEYVLVTRSINGDIIPIELISHGGSSITHQLNFLIPLISAVICITSLIICTVIVIHRRKIYGKYTKSKQSSLDNCITEYENQHNISNQQKPSPRHHVYSSPSVTYKQSPISRKEPEYSEADYEIYPYATFSVAEQQYHRTQFNQCKNGSPNNEIKINTQRRRKLSIPKSAADTLEISCISNQPTLPINKKNFCTSNMTTTFSSEAENTISRKKRPYQRNKEYEDSSTDSGEITPEIARRTKPRNGTSSRSQSGGGSSSNKLPRKFVAENKTISTENLTDQSNSKLLQHEKLNQELSSIVNDYRQRRIANKQTDYMIHV